MGAQSKGFTNYFNLVDNFTAKFDAIQKRIKSFTSSVYPIDFDIGGDVIAQTKEIGKNLAESSAGINKAAGGAGKAAKSASDGMKGAAEGAKGAKGEIEKSTSALEKMQSKMSGMTGFADTLKNKLGAITGLLTGGAIAGMAWSKAMDSQSITGSIYRKLERKNVDTTRLQEFVAGANIDIGSGSDRLKIADTLLSRTKIKGPKMESFVQDTEKFFAMNSTDLARYGISSSADLADLLTKKNLGRGEKQFLKDYGLSTGSVSSRAKSLTKANEGVTEEDIIKANPLDVFNRRLGDFSSKMGKTLVEPMLKVLTVANKIIDVINSIPGAPNLVAMGLVLVSASGAASLLATALAPLATVYSFLQKRMIAHAVTTQVLTVDEIMLTGATEAEAVAMVEANAASNLSWGAKLKLGAANIYASVATRAHSIATTANSAISWASAGAMAALATIYGVLTGSISLTTVATWALNAAMTILDALNPFTYIIAGAAILVGIVGLIAYKSGFLGTIWKDLTKIKFGKIFDDLMKGDFSGAWKKLSKGMGNVWEDVKIGASLIPEEITETITGKLSELVRWVTTSFPFLSKIHDVMKKVHSIFEWIYSLWQGFWSWIKSAMPGAAKEDARTKMEKQAGKEHLYLGSDKEWYKLSQDKDRKYTVKSGIRAYTEGSPKLQNLKKTYDELPGFAEGIAEAVAKGISSIGETIAAKIKEAMPDFPDFTPVTDALQKLQEAINNWLGNGKDKYEDTTAVDTSSGKAYEDKSIPGHFRIVLTDADGKETNSFDGNAADVEKYLGERPAIYAAGPRFDAGGTVHIKGFGILDPGDQIISPATATRGPGPIERALDALYGVTAGNTSSPMAPDSRPVEVHVHSSYDFSGMRVSSAVDVDKLMRDIDSRIRTGSVEAVKNAIGQRRT